MSVVGAWLFAVALGINWTVAALHVLWSDRPFYLMSRRVLGGRVPAARAAVLAVATLAFAALVLAFTLRGPSVALAVPVLAALYGIRRWEIAEWPGDIVVRLGKYSPSGACLLGWAAAQPALDALGWTKEAAGALGWDAACGVMAAIYVLAGVAKLRESGWSWVDARYQALLVAERAFSGPRVLRAVRLAAARSRGFGALMGFAGLGLEFAAILLVFPPLRPYVAGAIVALHVGFAVLLGYVEPEWSAVVLAITLLAA